MLNTVLTRRVRVLALILAMSVFLTSVTALAAISKNSKLIEADRGGKIRIDRGVFLIVPPGALEEDTVISAAMVKTRHRIKFYFKPHNMEFLKPVQLCVSWQVIDGIENITLYGSSGEAIEPQLYRWGVRYPLWHFSLYYYRRR